MLVIDGITIRHPCCGVDNCDRPLGNTYVWTITHSIMYVLWLAVSSLSNMGERPVVIQITVLWRINETMQCTVVGQCSICKHNYSVQTYHSLMMHLIHR